MARQKKALICLSCSEPNDADAKFCQNCGAPLYPVCASCGVQNKQNARFCKNCGASIEETPVSKANHSLASLLQSTPQALQEKIHAARAKLDGERKPVVILFTDIAGSTSFAERLDPEDWKAVVSGAHELVMQAVARYEGTIAQLLGDGVLAFFGAPVTHEDDPYRAVRAGLEIQQSVEAYRKKIVKFAPEFQMRVGIHAGLVVVGNIGSDFHLEYLAIGDAVNLAARLQSLASPGKVVISGKIYDSVAPTIESEDLGLLPIKGKQEPVQVYQVNGLRHSPSIGSERGKIVQAMIGREAELRNLQELIQIVEAGIGRTALIFGEPGIGKSRLAAEWKRWIETNCEEELSWVEFHCPSFGTGIAYSGVTRLIHSMMEVHSNDAKGSTRSGLETIAQQLLGAEAPETVAYLSHLMGLDLTQTDLTFIHGMNARALQVQYLAALQRLLLALAAEKPLVLLCEDLHWADPSSIEFFIELLHITQEAPVLFCTTARPSFDSAGWQLVTAARATIGAQLTEIHLTPLTEDSTQQMVNRMLNLSSSPPEIRKLIYEKSEGNPLFIEELVRSLEEAGDFVHAPNGWAFSKDIHKVDIPDSLKRLILSRVDRLDEKTRDILRVASVIGRQFPAPILERVLEENNWESRPGQLRQHLNLLETANIIYLSAAHPNILYSFKHALIHEAVYEALLIADRRVLHRAVAKELETTYSNGNAEIAATLGDHYRKGEVHRKAATYLAQAAQAAKARFANQEAIALYRSALEEVRREDLSGDADETWREFSVDLLENLGDLLSFSGQHEEARQVFQDTLALVPSSNHLGRSRILRKTGNAWMIPRKTQEALQAYDLAEASLGRIDDHSAPDRVDTWIDIQLDRVWTYYMYGNAPGMVKTIEIVSPSIERHTSPIARARFYRNLVLLAFRRDRFLISDETLDFARKSLASAQEGGDLGEVSFSTFVYGFCHLWRRELEEAEVYLLKTLDLAQKIGDMERYVLSLTYLSILYRQQNQVEKTAQFTKRSLEAASAAQMPLYMAIARANQVWLLWQEKGMAEAERLGKEVLKEHAAFPGPCAMYATWPIIDILLQQGRTGEAFDLISQVKDYFIQKNPALDETILESITLWNRGDQAPALSRLYQALEIAHDSGLL